MNGTIKRAEKGLTDLRTARNKAKLTQEALAGLVGTKRENISTWESGTKGLTLKTAKKLAEHLDVGAGELLTANRLSEYKRAKSEGGQGTHRGRRRRGSYRGRRAVPGRSR